MKTTENSDAPLVHWLVRPTTIRKLWIGFALLLASTVLLQTVVKIKGYFGIDVWFAFAAAFGFLACVALVVVAKGLGVVLKRDEGYYGD